MTMHTNEEMTSYVVCSRVYRYIDVLVLHPDGKLELTKESNDKGGIDVTDGNGSYLLWQAIGYTDSS